MRLVRGKRKFIPLRNGDVDGDFALSGTFQEKERGQNRERGEKDLKRA